MKSYSPRVPLINCLFLLLMLSSCDRGNGGNTEQKKTAGTQIAPRPHHKKSTTKKAAPAAINANGSDYYFISLRNKDKSIRDSARHFLKSLTSAERDIIFCLNRVDASTYARLDTIVMPARIDTNRMVYNIFPEQLDLIKDVHKMIIFAYKQEAFGAYENGRLIRWGPTSMGKKSTPTPTGLFFTNWKAKETISTVNDEWKLKWNFNIANYGGVGFHEYQLPGYPASHSCLRLLEEDAFYLYNWANQWIVSKGQLVARGTPVLVYGTYPFGKGKPWWKLVKDPAALKISADTLTALIQPNLEKILEAQKTRDSVEGGSQVASIKYQAVGKDSLWRSIK